MLLHQGFQLRQAALGHDLPGVHNRDALAQLLRFLHVVGGIQDGHPLAVELQNGFQDVVAALGVNAHGGFIQNQQLGFVHQAAGDVEPALHAPGKGLGALPAMVVQADQLQGLPGALLQLLAPQAIQRAEKPHVLFGCQVVINGQILGNDAQLVFALGQLPVQVQAVDGHLAPVFPDQACDDVDGGAFPGAIGPQQPEYLAFLH